MSENNEIGAIKNPYRQVTVELRPGESFKWDYETNNITILKSEPHGLLKVNFYGSGGLTDMEAGLTWKTDKTIPWVEFINSSKNYDDDEILTLTFATGAGNILDNRLVPTVDVERLIQNNSLRMISTYNSRNVYPTRIYYGESENFTTQVLELTGNWVEINNFGDGVEIPIVINMSNKDLLFSFKPRESQLNFENLPAFTIKPGGYVLPYQFTGFNRENPIVGLSGTGKIGVFGCLQWETFKYE